MNQIDELLPWNRVADLPDQPTPHSQSQDKRLTKRTPTVYLLHETIGGLIQRFLTHQMYYTSSMRCAVAKKLALLFSGFLISFFLVGRLQPRTRSNTFVFEGARLIPGDGTPPIENASIIVRQGMIDSVGAKGKLTIPRTAIRVDLSGKTIMPMLIDVHIHIGYMKVEDLQGKPVIRKENYSRENILDQLQRFEYYGVGAVQSLGTDRQGLEIQIRDEQRSGALRDPTLSLLFSAGDGILPSNNGSPNGGPSFANDVVHEVTNPLQARQYVEEEASKKVDSVKFWIDDRNGTKPTMRPEIYRAIIEEAHRKGLPVMAHIYYLDDAKAVVKAGVDGIAHPVRDKPIDKEFIELMKERNVFQCSTLSFMEPLDWIDDPELQETVGPKVRQAFKAEMGTIKTDNWKALWSLALQNEKKESDAGIRIALCGDTGGLEGQFPGFTEHRELSALAQAGISPQDVIRDGTQVPANVLGLKTMGTLAPGKRADFIVLQKNPLENIDNIRNITAIYKAGRAIDRGSLKAKWMAQTP